MRVLSKLGVAGVSAVALALFGCPHPTPTPNPPYDADAASPYPAATPADACISMALVGCEEGADVDCESTLTKIVALRLTPVDVRCLAAAHSKAAVHRCTSPVACR